MATTKPGGKFTKTEHRRLKSVLGQIAKGQLKRGQLQSSLEVAKRRTVHKAWLGKKTPSRSLAALHRNVRLHKIAMRVGKFKRAAA